VLEGAGRGCEAADGTGAVVRWAGAEPKTRPGPAKLSFLPSLLQRAPMMTVLDAEDAGDEGYESFGKELSVNAIELEVMNVGVLLL